MNPPKLSFVLALTIVMAANVYGQVLDMDGNPIFSGSYYVRPVIPGQGGGLTLRPRLGQLCPLGIIQEYLEFVDGAAVQFSNWSPKVAFVPESQDLNIKTDIAATICFQSTYWRVDKFDEKRKQYFIVVGEDSLKSFFKIEKSGAGYKFVFCPSTTESVDPKCSNVGIFVDEFGYRRLVLSDEPFLVKFKKA